MPGDPGIRINLVIISALTKLVNPLRLTYLERLVSKKVNGSISIFLYMTKTISFIPSSGKNIK